MKVDESVSRVTATSGERLGRTEDKVVVNKVHEADVKSGESPVTAKGTPVPSTPQETESKVLIDPSEVYPTLHAFCFDATADDEGHTPTWITQTER